MSAQFWDASANLQNDIQKQVIAMEFQVQTSTNPHTKWARITLEQTHMHTRDILQETLWNKPQN